MKTLYNAKSFLDANNYWQLFFSIYAFLKNSIRCEYAPKLPTADFISLQWTLSPIFYNIFNIPPFNFGLKM